MCHFADRGWAKYVLIKLPQYIDQVTHFCMSRTSASLMGSFLGSSGAGGASSFFSLEMGRLPSLPGFFSFLCEQDRQGERG